MKRNVLSFIAVFLVSGLVGPFARAETIMGKVQSMSATTVVIQTDAGDTRTMQLGAGVTPASGIGEGSQVMINYSMVNGQMVASSIAMSGTQSPMSQSPMNKDPMDKDPMSSSGNYSASQASQSGQAGEDPEYGGSMPRTASPMGILTLLGLLTLTGGAILRRSRVR